MCKQERSIVLLVLGYELPFPGAGWRRVEYFAKYLKEKGMDVILLGGLRFSFRKTKGEESKGLGGLKVLNILPFTVSPLYLLLTLLLVPLYTLALNPCLIMVSIPPIEPAIAFCVWKKVFKYRLVLDMRDDVLGEFITKKKGVERLYYRLISMLANSLFKKQDFIITVTKGLAKGFKKRYKEAKVVPVPNGADLNEFNNALTSKHECNRSIRKRENELVIIYSGAVVETHNPALILPSLMLLRKKNPRISERVKLVIMGSRTQLLDYMIGFAMKCGLNNIVYLGCYKNLKDVAKMLSCADIGLIPRVDDPFFNYAVPAKFYEYIAAGLPVLALCKRDSELAKIITENSLGFVCETKDVKCVEQTIKLLIENPSILHRLKENVKLFRANVDRRMGAETLYIILKTLLESN